MKTDELKAWLYRDISRRDKLLLMLLSIDRPANLGEIRECSKEAGFKIPSKWNLSQILGSSKGKAIPVPDGWELTEVGKMHLQDLGVAKISPAAKQVAVDLRDHLNSISDQETRAFVEEAIQCHEYKLYRSAIVMSWLAAMDVLLKHVHRNHLDDFNNESRRINKKWKVAKTPDDNAIMKESDFLDRIAAISVIGKNPKEELKKALGLRNGCGHPNTLQVGVNISAAHIETLLQNVFKKFQ